MCARPQKKRKKMSKKLKDWQQADKSTISWGP